MADSAYKKMAEITPSTLKDEDTRAYYNLLLTWTRYVKYLPFTTDSLINQSINHYQQKGEKEKLALAYAVKGEAVYETGNTTEAVRCLKECEHIAQTQGDNFLDNKLYGALTMINCQQNEYELALKYGQKRLETARRSKNVSWIAGCLNQLAVCFSGLNKPDSASRYINLCIPYIKDVADEEKVIMLDNIGFFNMEAHPDTAVKYLLMAASIAPSADTYDNLARIYAVKGQEKKADSLWNLALGKSNLKQKVTIIEAILKHKSKGKYTEKETGPLKSQLLVLKDSLTKSIKGINVEKQQYNFDYQTAQHSQDTSISILTKVLTGLGVVFITTLVLFLHKQKRHKQRMLQHKNMIRLLEADLEKKDKTIENLKMTSECNKKRFSEQKKTLEAQRSDIQSGQLLFKEIEQGRTTADWKKKDYEHIFIYYTIIHPAFAERVFQTYPRTTAHQKLYLILKEENWEDERIARCLCINKDSLRTINYRLNKT